MKARTEPCGCKSDDRRWLHLCDEHRREHDDTHERWQRERETDDIANISPRSTHDQH